jgi:hypothetical protein
MRRRKRKEEEGEEKCIRISQCTNQAAASRNWNSIPAEPRFFHSCPYQRRG